MKKELGDKIDKIKSEVSAQEKALSRQLTDNQKSLQDKLSAQEKGNKELSDKIGIKPINVAIYNSCVSAKLEKSDSSNVSRSGGETAKLATLTKAIDSIQENSKSLETMGRFILHPTEYAEYHIDNIPRLNCP